MDPLRQHSPMAEDDRARRRGEEMVEFLHSVGMTDAEIASDDAVAMTLEEMNAWLLSGAPSPLPPLR